MSFTKRILVAAATRQLSVQPYTIANSDHPTRIVRAHGSHVNLGPGQRGQYVSRSADSWNLFLMGQLTDFDCN
jgi:hypothetical protein